MKLLKLTLLIGFLSFCSVKSEPISIACALGYVGAVALDSLSSLVPDANSLLYGTKQADMIVQLIIVQTLGRINARHKAGLQSPSNVQESYPFWNVIAGHIFSNQKTLFISKNVSNTLMKAFYDNKNTDAMFKSLSEQERKELIMSSLMMAANYDNKVLGLALVTPVAIWTLAYIGNAVTKKVQSYLPLDPMAHVSHKVTHAFHKSFKAKALVSALIFGAYIVLQRHAFALQAQKFL